jgi:hypothetical protein
MTVRLKDVFATLFTGVVLAIFLATHEGWNVWLVGDSHRWAAAAIGLLGIATCGLGSPGPDGASKLLAILGIAALPLAVVALATGSLAPLSFLVADIVLLWAGSMLRHAHHEARRPVAG